ncbi:MAG: hypothetical protein ACF8GE_01905 [Phycisphaerales bacterium JB043]
MHTSGSAQNRLVRVSVALLVACVCVTGCAKKKFYRVTDLSDGTVFYTKTFDPREAEDIGMARFVDARSAALIRLEEYEAEKISKRTFRRYLRTID